MTVDETTLTTLRNSNIGLGLAHFVVCSGIIAMTSTLFDEQNAFPTQSYVTTTIQRSSQEEFTPYTTVVSTGGKNVIKGLLIAFSAWTCLAHFSYGSFLQPKYNEGIRKGNNQFRWIEYLVSATLMVVIIALSSGVSDFNDLMVLAATNACVMLLGQVCEATMTEAASLRGWHNKIFRSTSGVAFLVGLVLFFCIWSFIWVQFGQGLQRVEDENIPWFVPLLIGLMFVAFGSFGVVQFIQLICSSPNQSYPRYEKAYMILSALAKTILPLVFAIGLAMRSDPSNQVPPESQAI